MDDDSLGLWVAGTIALGLSLIVVVILLVCVVNQRDELKRQVHMRAKAEAALKLRNCSKSCAPHPGALDGQWHCFCDVTRRAP
jgi:heme exporter protein D